MSQIMKTFLGIFMILLMTLSVVGILGAFMNVLAAQNLHAQIISELEDSNYNQQVIRDSFDKANQAGQELGLELYLANGNNLVCRSWEETEEVQGQIDMARVELKFNFEVAFFDIKSSHVLSGFAR